MEKQQYGEEFNEHLLEQYTMYAEMADRVSERRLKTNQFYISLLSVLLAILSFVVSKEASSSFGGIQNIVFVAVALLGIVLCVVWYANINSYKQLNKLKFRVVHEMEQNLPFACYDREWEVLKEEEKKGENKYNRLTKVEKYVPFIMGIPYILLLIFAFYMLF